MATGSTTAPSVSGTILKNFPGTSKSKIIELKGGADTPDPNGCVDGNYFHELLNGTYTKYFKENGKVESRITDTQFWEDAGIPASYLFDPRLLFVDGAGPSGKGILFACQLGSKQILLATSDPYGASSTWRGVTVPTADAPDLPRAAYDTKSLSVVISSGQHYDQEIRYFPRWTLNSFPLLVGYAKTFKYAREIAGETLHPVLETTVGYPNRGYAYYVGVDTSSKIGLTYGWLEHSNLEGGLKFGKIPVGNFEYAVNRAHQPGDQANNPSLVFGGQGIVTPPYRVGNNIWVVHHTTGQAQNVAIRWYRLEVNEGAQWPLRLAATGLIQSAPPFLYDYFNGSIIQAGGSVVLCCNRSGQLGTSTNPKDPSCGNAGMYAVYLNPDSTEFEVVPIRAGLAANYKSSVKWGDYSTVCLDPENPKTVWMTNQLVLKGGETPAESDYATQIAAIQF